MKPIRIHTSEEFGLRHWIWTPSEQDWDKLVSQFHSAMERIGYAANPQWVDPEGEWQWITLDFPEGDCPDGYPESCECLHCEGEWVDGEGKKVEVPTEYVCHIHSTDDSYLDRSAT